MVFGIPFLEKTGSPKTGSQTRSPGMIPSWEAGINSNIIVLFDCTDITDFFDYKLTPVIHDIRTAREFSKEAISRKQKISVQMKIDTGMGRIGFDKEKAVSAAVEISEMDGIELEGLLSHF